MRISPSKIVTCGLLSHHSWVLDKQLIHHSVRPICTSKVPHQIHTTNKYCWDKLVAEVYVGRDDDTVDLIGRRPMCISQVLHRTSSPCDLPSLSPLWLAPSRQSVQKYDRCKTVWNWWKVYPHMANKLLSTFDHEKWFGRLCTETREIV